MVNAGRIKFKNKCIPALGWYAGAQTIQAAPSAVWVHIMYTYDGTYARFYKNGALEDSTHAPCLMDGCVGGGVRFGVDHLRYFASTGDPFNGTIDDIGIWNKGLTSDEISKIYTQSSSITDCGYGKMGINVYVPQRNLHIKDIIRLEPGDTEPQNPGEGDIYYDSTPFISYGYLMVHNGKIAGNLAKSIESDYKLVAFFVSEFLSVCVPIFLMK